MFWLGKAAMSFTIAARTKALTAIFVTLLTVLSAPVAVAQVKSVDPNSALGTVPQTATQQTAARQVPPAPAQPKSEDFDQDLVKSEGTAAATPRKYSTPRRCHQPIPAIMMRNTACAAMTPATS